PPVEVTRFREKPDPAQAAEFLAQGNFAWNGGMFVWSVATVMDRSRASAGSRPTIRNSVVTMTNAAMARIVMESVPPVA
ncbi:MAG: hypothetical protein EOO78_24735, partial [Oxalobacteraceae bacterium]